MKLFENIAEHQAFKRKYEMMEQLEEAEGRLDESGEEHLRAMLDFCEFVAKVQKNTREDEDLAREKLQARVALQGIFSKVPLRHG